MMKKLLTLISVAGLLLVIAPPIAYLAGQIDKTTMMHLMLAGTLAWFAGAPLLAAGARR
ncbi:MAG TPA: hypothetical protein VFY03_07920 [Woeseiaceae bacterium]|jgi:hypothetical protein|nr:hypothetical protein [Woeseiaceae bacterium]